jgi:hypothetical protein
LGACQSQAIQSSFAGGGASPVTIMKSIMKLNLWGRALAR